METLSNIQKVRIALYYWMIGKGFNTAAEVMNVAEKMHSGLRKDGVTPEFHHQISIANFIRTLNLPDHMMELCLCIAFLHDTAEDKDVGFEEIEHKYGVEIADGVKRLTKKHRGVVIPKETYFSELSKTVQSAIVKGVDRLNNLSTMVGVFTKEKQQKYIDETIEWHLPMLKEARKKFPQYEMAFENIKQHIKLNITLVQQMLTT